MKIGMLSYPKLAGPAFAGGGNTNNELIRRILEEAGHLVEYITYDSAGASAGTVSSWLGRFRSLTRLASANAYLHAAQVNQAAEAYDLVLCDNVVNYHVRHPKCVVLFNLSIYGYGNYVPGERRGPAAWIKYQILSRLEVRESRNKFNIPCSNFLKEILEEQGIAVYRVIQNAVDTERFAPAATDRRGYLYAGGYSYLGKGFDVLEKLAARGVEIDCVTNRAPAGNLRHLPSVEHGAMPEVYNRYRILFYPSRFETFGLVPLEAMACGVPVIMSNVGFGRDLQKEIPEFVVEGHDDAAVDEYLRRIALIESDYESFSRKAWRYAVEHHSLEKFRTEWLKLVEDINAM